MNRRYPPQKPYKQTEPKRVHYRLVGSKKKEPIYRDVSVLGDRDDIDLEEWFADQDEEFPPEPDIRRWNNLSLQDIIDLAPPNTKLCDIILKINYPRYLEYLDVSFALYQRNLKAEEDDYQKALKKYQEHIIQYEQEMIQYEKELDDYNKWAKEEELKNLERQIRKLKKSK